MVGNICNPLMEPWNKNDLTIEVFLGPEKKKVSTYSHYLSDSITVLIMMISRQYQPGFRGDRAIHDLLRY